MSRSFDLPSVDAIAIGTVGPPGERVFYLQARLGAETASLKIEKQQAAALAVAFAEAVAAAPEPVGPAEQAALEAPDAPDWVVGEIAVSQHDPATDRTTVVLAELVRDPEEEAPGATARLGVTRSQMAALAQQAAELVDAGRPPCDLCGFPLGPGEHVCPKGNGHLKR